jgi:hypothetical protein
LARCFAFLFAAFVALLAWPAGAANNPKLLWKTIETEHFRIDYYSTEDDVARHVAALAEGIYGRLAPSVGWSPSEKTEVVLADQTDGANGSASALPYNAVHLNVTAPDDMSPLGDVDDWYLELVTHEYTHILHTDHVTGIPALINRILGKSFAPNQVEPHWMLEGLAVYEESERTSGGRLRSSMWNMWMRADVLEDNVAPLDVFSNVPRRWPQGNIWYVYGSFFMRWIAETYGEQAIRAMIDDYSRQIIPYAINRSVRRATGRTFEELFPSFVASLRRSFGAQADAARARGLREGIRLTHTGNTYEHPRWLPANAWPDHAGELAFFVDDGHTASGIWALPLVRDEHGAILGSNEARRDLLIRTNGPAALTFFADGTAAFNSSDIHDNLFAFNDLFELPAHEKSPQGTEGARVRWTDGWRALAPALSPDGRRVVFTTNHRGTTYLMQADVVPAADHAGAHDLANVRPLVRSAMFDQAFTPRWSPDGRHVAYSAWAHGGWRDVRIVDVSDGSFVEIAHDRAIDGDPVYSPDGKWLYFHSDRTGIMNVYAYEVATGRLKQVTNVINGAYQPEPSADGKWLAYVGYTHEGYDVFVIHLDESQWLEALPYVDTRPAPPPDPPPADVTPVPYNPLHTLVPRHYSMPWNPPTLVLTPGNFGQATIITAAGADAAGHHAVSATLTIEWEHPELQPDVSYTYGRLPFDFSVHAFRSIAPRTDYKLGDNSLQWIEQDTGITTELGYSLPRAFDSQGFAIAYTAANVTGQLPAAPLNPYDTPSIPSRGLLGTAHLGWSFNNAQGWLWSVGAERGFNLGASFDVATPWIGSDFFGYAINVNFNTYLQMPWLRHHTLALHAGGGVGGDNRGGRGPFYIGGFIDLPLVNVIQNSLIQGGVTLRGYPVVAQAGDNYGLFNAEYRFPILNVDRGLSTLPLFLNRISGAAFVDCGSVFDNTNAATFLTGVGGELWFDLNLGYVLGFTFRLGQARGLSNGGIDKTYFVAAVPF